MKKAALDLEFHEIKAFTQKGMNVTGNPAAIALVGEFPDEALMGEAAKILAAPMTTFVRPTETPGVYDIRHFSPDGDECHVCGHATMAAVQFLAGQDPSLKEKGAVLFRMNPKFGVSDKNEIQAKIDGEDISLTLPAIAELKPIRDPEFYHLLSEALQVPEAEIVRPAYFAPRVRDIVVAFMKPETLLALEPDFGKLKKMALFGKYAHEGMMGTAKSNRTGFDLINRVFLPGIDVDEDIACGSANCSVIPYWYLKSGGAFDDAQKDFKVVYPYPPGGKQQVGGVQKLRFNAAAAEIVLTGQATAVKKIPVRIIDTPKRTGTLG